MNESQQLEQERRVLRWGGLTGMIGSIVFIIVFVIVFVFIGSDPNEPMGFPEIQVARTFEDGLYLAVFVLWIPHFLALYRALRAESLAPALFGSVLGIVGIVVLAAGALPHIVTLRVSELFHAQGTTAGEQAALELMWKAVYGVFDALLVVGLIFATIGVICLGAAMVKNTKFGKGIGWISVVLGVIGTVTAAVLLWSPSMLAAIALFTLIIFHVVAGWKTYRLSKNL
jgi:hypothetical protein